MKPFKKIIYVFAVLFVLTSCTKAPYNDNHSRPLISFEGGHKSRYRVSYDLVEPEKHDYFSNIILAEMAKYPDGFFDKIGLDTIAIGKNLQVNNVHMSGTVDNYNHILFISTDANTKHTFHHELNHYVDFFIWGSDQYDWDQWRVLYTGSDVGGFTAIQEAHSIWNLTHERPYLPGFLSNYSMLAPWEDRAEMMAFYLTDSQNALFIQKARRDEVFYQKAVTLFTLYKERLDFNLLDEFLLQVNNLNYSHLRHLISFTQYTDTWNRISYDFLEPEKQDYYSTLILAEMDKYPDGFFDQIGLDAVVIGKNLQYDNVFRAAIPDNDMRILFVGVKYDYTDSYIKQAFHHEMNHYIEFSVWKDYHYDWDQWRALYTGSDDGGVLAHQGRITNAQSGYRPDIPGFLNTFSMLCQEEDRSEMMSHYLADNLNVFFIQKARKDGVFYQKAVTLFTFYKERLGFNLLDEFLSKVNQ